MDKWDRTEEALEEERRLLRGQYLDLKIAYETLEEAVEELLRWGVEHDDSRISYIGVQVDREAAEEVRRALADGKKAPAQTDPRPGHKLLGGGPPACRNLGSLD